MIKINLTVWSLLLGTFNFVRTSCSIYVVFNVVSVFLACELFGQVTSILVHGKCIERFALSCILLQFLSLETSLAVQAEFFRNAQGVHR